MLYYLPEDFEIGYKSSGIRYNNIIVKISKVINTYFRWHLDYNLLQLYRDIVDEYCLYLSDLLNITDMKTVIESNYCLPSIHNFFFLPFSPDLSDVDMSIIDIEKLSDKLNVSILLDDYNYDIVRISNLVSLIAEYALYAHKEDFQKPYNINEVNRIISLIDSGFNVNKTQNIHKRANSLYIWDKKYICGGNLSIANYACKLEKPKNDNEKNNICRTYQNFVSATCKCIELKRFLPLTYKKSVTESHK